MIWDPHFCIHCNRPVYNDWWHEPECPVGFSATPTPSDGALGASRSAGSGITPSTIATGKPPASPAEGSIQTLEAPTPADASSQAQERGERSLDLTVKTAAIRIGEAVFTLPRPNRHHNVMWWLSVLGIGPGQMREQGFVLSNGRFAGRFDAANLALGGGQVKKLIAPPNLYSEDLWDGGGDLPSIEQIRALGAPAESPESRPPGVEQIARMIDPTAFEEYYLEDGRVDVEVANIFEDAVIGAREAAQSIASLFAPLEAEVARRDAFIEEWKLLATTNAAQVKELEAENARLRASLQELSDAADQINGEIDKQIYDEMVRADFDNPNDHQYGVFLTAGDIRAMNSAICGAQILLRQALDSRS